MTINQKQKGKRVELDFVHWLKENQVLSARRSEQYNGAAGLSDVLALTELPSWHIEVKGVKAPKISRSIFTSWVAQVLRDNKCNQHGVIAFKPNNYDFMCAVLDSTVRAHKSGYSTITISNEIIYPLIEDSITPHIDFKKKQKEIQVLNALQYEGALPLSDKDIRFAYMVYVDNTAYAVQIMSASAWLHMALEGEKNKQQVLFPK